MKQQLTRKAQERIEKVEAYRLKNDLKEPKCISDKILLYLRYGIDEVIRLDQERLVRRCIKDEFVHVKNPHPPTEDQIKGLFTLCMNLYKKVRGEIKYTNKNPIATAAGILRISLIQTGFETTSNELEKIYNITSMTILKASKELYKDFITEKEKIDVILFFLECKECHVNFYVDYNVNDWARKDWNETVCPHGHDMLYERSDLRKQYTSIEKE